ncbi:hypothetical protein D3C81_1437030 [compost metagenome]
MQQQAATAHAVDQPCGDDATHHEQPGDCDRTIGSPFAREVQCIHDPRGEGVNGENGDDGTGPEDGNEEHPLAIAGTQQIDEGQLQLFLFRGYVLQSKVLAEDLLDDHARFLFAALAQQPAWRLGGANAYQDDQRSDRCSTRQRQTPAVLACVEDDRFTCKVGNCCTGKPAGGEAGQAWSTIAFGQELDQEGGGGRVLKTDADADYYPQ